MRLGFGLLLGCVLAFSGAATLSAQPAAEQTQAIAPPITERDVNRLKQMLFARRAVISNVPRLAGRQVDATTARRFQREMRRVATRNPLPADLVGDWQCRSNQFDLSPGAVLGYVQYGWFNCAIRADGARGFILEKTSGSQQLVGRLMRRTDGNLLYFGVSVLPVSSPPGLGPDSYPLGTDADQVGVFYVTSTGANGTARLELPEPGFNESYEVLEFRRR
jgi:hypothetical protein